MTQYIDEIKVKNYNNKYKTNKGGGTYIEEIRCKKNLYGDSYSAYCICFKFCADEDGSGRSDHNIDGKRQ